MVVIDGKQFGSSIIYPLCLLATTTARTVSISTAMIHIFYSLTGFFIALIEVVS
jgi:hypothetical protein